MEKIEGKLTEYNTIVRHISLDYEYFPEEDEHVLTVVENGEAMNMFHNEKALELLEYIMKVDM